MPDIDFTKSLARTGKKTIGLKNAVVRLLEHVMNDVNTTDEERAKIAKARSYIDIHLKDL